MFTVHEWVADQNGIQILKPFSDQKIKIVDFVEELIKTGYDVVEVEPIQEHRQVFYTKIKIYIPMATE